MKEKSVEPLKAAGENGSDVLLPKVPVLPNGSVAPLFPDFIYFPLLDQVIQPNLKWT